MVVHHLDIKGISASPPKANTPLIIYSNTVLPSSITHQLLQAVRGRDPKVTQRLGGIQHKKLAQCDTLNPAESPGSPPLKDLLSFLAAKPFDHGLIVTRRVNIVKRY
jgi:hypothetical protein